MEQALCKKYTSFGVISNGQIHQGISYLKHTLPVWKVRVCLWDQLEILQETIN